MEVTHHGVKRARHRPGLPKKAVAREAERAWDDGTKPEDMPGELRHYCKIKGDDHNAVARIYGEHLFFFSEDGVLITAYPVPARYRRDLTRGNRHNCRQHEDE